PARGSRPYRPTIVGGCARRVAAGAAVARRRRSRGGPAGAAGASPGRRRRLRVATYGGSRSRAARTGHCGRHRRSADRDRPCRDRRRRRRSRRGGLAPSGRPARIPALLGVAGRWRRRGFRPALESCAGGAHLAFSAPLSHRSGGRGAPARLRPPHSEQEELIVTGPLWIVIICGVIALAYGIFLINSVMAAGTGTDRMREIAAAVQEGARAYLNRQYTTIGIVGIVMGAILWIFLGKFVGIGYFIGAILSGATGYIGMNVSVRSNLRTADAARQGLQPALTIAFKA